MSISTRLRTALILLLTFAAYGAAIEWCCGWRPLLNLWVDLPSWLLASFLATSLSSWLLRALRLYTSCPDIPAGAYLVSLRLLWLHNACNLLLPARVGEAALPWLLRRRLGLAWPRATGLLLWLRLLDLHCVAVLALLALMQRDQGATAAGLIMLAMGAAASMPLLAFIVRRRLQQADATPLSHWRQALTAVPPSSPALLRELALSWSAWTLKLAGFAIVLRTIAGTGSAVALLGAIGGDASTLLPIHAPGGAGTFEAGVVLGMSAAGQAVAAAVTLHLLIIGTTLGTVLLSLPELPVLNRHDALAC
nr:lysylphosphatidylglycerol synthase domain-containing protein [Solimonas marina]